MRKAAFLLRLDLLPALFLVSAAALFAQTASVDGVVTDQSNAVMPGVLVSVTNLETGLRRDVRTNEDGHYTVPLLPAGRYKVEVSVSGFGKAERPEVKLDVQQVARIDFVMQPGAVVETVSVS